VAGADPHIKNSKGWLAIQASGQRLHVEPRWPACLPVFFPCVASCLLCFSAGAQLGVICPVVRCSCRPRPAYLLAACLPAALPAPVPVYCPYHLASLSPACPACSLPLTAGTSRWC
jgi:hypothetical protein